MTSAYPYRTAEQKAQAERCQQIAYSWPDAVQRDVAEALPQSCVNAGHRLTDWRTTVAMYHQGNESPRDTAMRLAMYVVAHQQRYSTSRPLTQLALQRSAPPWGEIGSPEQEGTTP